MSRRMAWRENPGGRSGPGGPAAGLLLDGAMTVQRRLGLRHLALLALTLLGVACSGGREVSDPPATPVGIYVGTEPAGGGTPADRAILTFALDASGDARPLRRIAGDQTGLANANSLGGLALSQGGEIFVGGTALGPFGDPFSEVVIFSPMADGNARPSRGFSVGGVRVHDVALGPDGRIYVTSSDNAVRVYAPGAAGPALPERTIRGPRTLLSGPMGVAVDSDGFIYVANMDSNRVVIFSPTANGDVDPVHQFSGPLTQLSQPAGLALDRFGRIYVANPVGTAPRVTVYSSRHPTNTPPAWKIEGPSTMLVAPADVAVDSRGRVVVADAFRKAVLVYAPGASGDAAPAARIEGPSTQLGRPLYVFVQE